MDAFLHGRSFHLEITSLAEFAEFCLLIRNLSTDAVELLAQIARLKASAAALQSAVDANQPSDHPPV
jgi:hypothetical protein